MSFHMPALLCRTCSARNACRVVTTLCPVSECIVSAVSFPVLLCAHLHATVVILGTRKRNSSMDPFCVACKHRYSAVSALHSACYQADTGHSESPAIFSRTVPMICRIAASQHGYSRTSAEANCEQSVPTIETRSDWVCMQLSFAPVTRCRFHDRPDP